MKLRILSLFWLVLAAAPLRASVINYRGRIMIDKAPMNGIGRFRFALIGEQGNIVWSSDDITLNVSDGAYAVRLGDSAQAPPIGDAILQSKTPPKLRIWLDRKEKGWVVLDPNIALSNDSPANTAVAAGSENGAILAELREIHALLAGKQGGTRPPEPEIVTVSTAGAPTLGNADAPLVLVEYTDFQCTFCIKFQNEVFEQLKAKYVSTGKLRIVSRHVPLPFHPYAEPAARAAFCADAQGKFWPLRERLFAANGALADEAIKQAAQDTRLDVALLDTCSTSKETAAAIQKEVQEAKAVGIEATPTFVLGKATGDTVRGLKIVGALPLATFETEINKQLPPEKQP